MSLFYFTRHLLAVALPSEKNKKTARRRLRGEQRRRRCEKAPGFDGEDDGDEIERDGAEGTPAAAAATLQFPPGWQYLLAADRRRMNSNVEGVPLPGWLCVSLSSVRLAQRGGVSAASQQEALCVCVCVRALKHPPRKHFICGTVCLPYLHLS